MVDIITVSIYIFVTCILWYCYKIWKTLQFFKIAGIPYVKGLPIVGNIGPTLLQRTQIGPLLENLYSQWPQAKYMGFFDCMTPTIMIRDPELIKSMAIKNFDHFTDHYGFTGKNDTLFGNSLFSLRGLRWKEMRSLLTPSFTSSKLKQLYAAISKCAMEFVDDVVESSSKGVTQYDMKNISSRYTNDIICKFSLNIDVDSVKNPTNEIYKTCRKIFAFDGVLSERFFLLKNFPWIAEKLNIQLFDKRGQNFFKDLINRTIAIRNENNVTYSDMLQVMLNAHHNPNGKVKIGMGDVISETFIFFFGGFDTTSSYLSNTVYHLATQPEVQKKLQDEIDLVWKETKGSPTFEAIQGMLYLDSVVTEAGRTHGPVPFLERMCTKSFELPPAMPGYKPYVIQPGTNICFPSYAIHHDEEYYPDPEKFDPDRFSDKSVATDSGLYMPFGIGPRLCIGARLAILEMKLFLFHLLRNVNLKPTSTTCVPMKLLTTSFVVSPHKGTWLVIEKRNNN